MRKTIVGLAVLAVAAAGSTFGASAGYDRDRVQHPPGWHGTGIWHGYQPHYYHRYYGHRGYGPGSGYYRHGYHPRYYGKR
jgi:hypothetical protein